MSIVSGKKNTDFSRFIAPLFSFISYRKRWSSAHKNTQNQKLLLERQMNKTKKKTQLPWNFT